MYKLSFCVTCMNRVEFLKKTLLPNLNLIYSLKNDYNIEIVLINYDSKDDTDDYVKSGVFDNFIKENFLIYKKVYNKKFFYRANAKNISHLNAIGDILCNLDVDCFLSKELIEETYNCFIENDIDSIIVHHPHGVNWGYICLSKYNFKLIEGYDENMYYYGCEDNDIIIRFILKTNGKIKRISNYNHLTIEHSDDLRSDMSYNKGMTNYANSIICDYNLRNNITNPNNGIYGDEKNTAEIKEIINYNKYILNNEYETKLYENISMMTNDNWIYNDLSNKFFNFIINNSF